MVGKKALVWLIGAVVACIAAAACGGSSQPTATPTPTPMPTATSSGSGATATSTQSSSSSAWNQIVQKAKQEGTVTVYGTGDLRGTQGAQIAQAFEQAYGIKVNDVAGAGSPTYQRIQQEVSAGATSADLAFLSPPWPATFQQAGLYQSISGEPLPVFSEPASTWKIDPRALNSNGLYVITTFSEPNAHVTVNTSLLSPSDYPTSFAQLATDPKYKGKIIVDDPHTTQDPAFLWMQWGYVGNAYSLQDLWDIYVNQKPFVASDPGTEITALTAGQGAIMLGVWALTNAAGQGAPIKPLRFADAPTMTSVDTIGMVKGATHPDAALVFINWLLSKDGQQALSQIGLYEGIRHDVPSGLPSVLANPVVVGNGNSPEYVVTAEQAQLPAYIYKDANSAWLGLTSNIGLSDFQNAVNGSVAKWEAQNGSHRQGVPAK